MEVLGKGIHGKRVVRCNLVLNIMQPPENMVKKL
jgi:hypothetical protein